MPKRRSSKRTSNKTNNRKKVVSQSWFQKLSNFFTKIFEAPSQRSAKIRKNKAIAEIKAKNYSPSYERRLTRAVESGKKPTLQSVRGHKPDESRRRAEREKLEQGLTSAQIKAIRNFERRFNPRGLKDGPSVERMIEFAQQSGYQSFVAYRKRWDSIRANYVKELNSGTWASRGEDYLDIDYGDDEIDDVPDVTWLYYH